MTMPLLDYCRIAIRANGSRRRAYRSWHKYTPGTSWEEFCTFWATARTLEARKVKI